MKWHGYLLIKQPASGISNGNWQTYLAYLYNQLNTHGQSDNPNQRLHAVTNGTATLIESVFNTEHLTTQQFATWINAAVPSISYSQAVALLETNEGRRWQVFSIGAAIDSVRVHVRSHLQVYGWNPRGPRSESGNVYYVSPTGLAENTGTIESPWSLTHVLSGASGVLQKDTIVMRGGLYFNDTPGTGWTFGLQGYSHQEPITFRAYLPDWLDGNPPIIAPEASVTGVYLHFRNIKFTGRLGDRGAVTGTGESGVTQLKVGLKLIGCHLIDNDSNGIATQTGDDTEIDMCIVANNGRWTADGNGDHAWSNGQRVLGKGRGSAHGMYIQGEGDIGKLIKHCLIYNNAGNQISSHGSGNFINNISFVANAIANGNLNTGDQSRLINYVAHENHCDMVFVKFGNRANNEQLSVTNNIIRNDSPPLLLYKWSGVTSTGNTVITTNNGDDVFYVTLPISGTIDNNEYCGGDINPFRYEETPGARYSFAQWKGLGWDNNSTWQAQEPSSNCIFVYPNTYQDESDPIVGMVVIWNFADQSSQSVNLSALELQSGATYRIYNGYNRYGQSPVLYTSNGNDTSVTIDLSGLTVAIPEGTYAGVTISEPVAPLPPKMRVFIIERDA